MRYSVVTPIDVTGSISAACGRVNKKFRPFAARPEEARQVPAKRRRQASFGAEEDEKRREGGGGQGGEPGRRRGLPARSEERRVGKEWRSRGGRGHEKEKEKGRGK